MRKQSDREARGGRSRRFFIKVAVVLVAVLAGLIIFEVFLRAVGYTYPVFYEPDGDLGYVLKPGMEGWYRKEGESYVRINSDGLRDREHSREKSPGTLRIAVVGDSYAEALQVPQDNAFWLVMEKRLTECKAVVDRRVEVINFGVSGYGTAQELITLRKRVWDYSPDIVLLVVTTNNDVSDNSRVLKRTDEIPYFHFEDGRLVLDNSFRNSSVFRLRQSVPSRAGRWIRDRMRAIQAIHQAHGAIKMAIAERRSKRDRPEAAQTTAALQARTGADAAPVAPGDEHGVDNLIYREPSDAVWNDAWRVTESLISEMQREVEGRGARFVAVTVSSAIQVHPSPDLRTAFMRGLGIETLFYPDLRIKNLGDREGFPVINLAQDLQIYAERNNVFLHGFGPQIGNGHWNERGHALAGEILSEKLCRLSQHK